MSKGKVEIVVVGQRCVYINDYRVAGRKPYVSENLPQHSFWVDPSEIIRALGALGESNMITDKTRIERLRQHARHMGGDTSYDCLFAEEANDIAARLDALSAEIARLKRELEIERTPTNR